MELIREHPIAREARFITDWPKVPELSIAATRIADVTTEVPDQPNCVEEIRDSKDEQPEEPTRAAEEDGGNLHNPHPKTAKPTLATEPPKTQALEHRWLNIKRFSLQKSEWPDPHLSIGTKCNRMGSNECWEATGPAQELFAQISQSVGDLLNARVDDIEEGEPVAGHILTFGMYMIGKGPRTARPTLIFTCQRPKPRRRAIKFIKESEILKNYPKIALAESAVVPMTLGSNYLRLLARPSGSPPTGSASRTGILKRDTTTPSASSALTGAQVAGIVSGTLGLVLIVAIFTFVIVRRRLRKVVAMTSGETEKTTSRNRTKTITSGSTGTLPVPLNGSELHEMPDELLFSPAATSNRFSLRSPIYSHESLGHYTPEDITVLTPSPTNSRVSHYENKKGNSISGKIVAADGSIRRELRATSPAASADRASTLMSSGTDARPFALGGEGDTDSQSETVFDSLSSGATGSIPSHNGPPDSKFNESLLSVSRPKNKRLSMHELLWSVALPGGSVVEEDEGMLEQRLSPSGETASYPVECTDIYGMPFRSEETRRRATIGGVIRSMNKYYGLTVGHVFANNRSEHKIAPSETQGDDLEFAFDEEEDEAEIDLSDITATSQASLSLELSRSASTNTTSWGMESSSESIATEHASTKNDNKNSMTEPTSPSFPEPRGISTSSVSKTDLTHDWALIELSETSVMQAQPAIRKDSLLENILLPTLFTNSPPRNEREIVAIKGFSGISRGSISSSTTMMRLQPRGTFQEVWTVRLDDDNTLVEGDSGSWVIDAVTGDLYGHIVAGVPEAQLAYIIPAKRTFRNIEELMGAPIELVSIAGASSLDPCQPSAQTKDKVEVARISQDVERTPATASKKKEEHPPLVEATVSLDAGQVSAATASSHPLEYNTP